MIFLLDILEKGKTACIIGIYTKRATPYLQHMELLKEATIPNRFWSSFTCFTFLRTVYIFMHGLHFYARFTSLRMVYIFTLGLHFCARSISCSIDKEVTAKIIS